MAKGIRGENVQGYLYNPHARFAMSWASNYRGFRFQSGIGLLIFRHIDCNGPRWLIETA